MSAATPGGRALGGEAGYKRLVRLLARAFYAGECPPREPEEEVPAGARTTRRDKVRRGGGARRLSAPAAAAARGPGQPPDLPATPSPRTRTTTPAWGCCCWTCWPRRAGTSRTWPSRARWASAARSPTARCGTCRPRACSPQVCARLLLLLLLLLWDGSCWHDGLGRAVVHVALGLWSRGRGRCTPAPNHRRPCAHLGPGQATCLPTRVSMPCFIAAFRGHQDQGAARQRGAAGRPRGRGAHEPADQHLVVRPPARLPARRLLPGRPRARTPACCGCVGQAARAATSLSRAHAAVPNACPARTTAGALPTRPCSTCCTCACTACGRCCGATWGRATPWRCVATWVGPGPGPGGSASRVQADASCSGARVGSARAVQPVLTESPCRLLPIPFAAAGVPVPPLRRHVHQPGRGAAAGPRNRRLPLRGVPGRAGAQHRRRDRPG